MKLTKSELKNLINECLAEELHTTTKHNRLREYYYDGYKTLNDLFKDYDQARQTYELDYEELEEIFNEYANVDEVKKYSSRATYDNIFKHNPNLVLKLHYGDIGDGHGDFVSYIMCVDDKLYQVVDCSNGGSMAPIYDYNDFKDCVTRDMLFDQITLNDGYQTKFDSALLSLEHYTYDDIVAIIRNEGIVDSSIDPKLADDEEYEIFEYSDDTWCDFRDS